MLLADPTGLAAFGAAVNDLLADEERAAAMGAAAHERVRDHFMSVRHLIQYEQMFSMLKGGAKTTTAAPRRAGSPTPAPNLCV